MNTLTREARKAALEAIARAKALLVEIEEELAWSSVNASGTSSALREAGAEFEAAAKALDVGVAS